MMKKFKIISIAFFFCARIATGQVITDLEIYYLPWSMRPDAQLEAEEVRDYNHGKNSYFCIQDSVIIDRFIKSMSIFYLRPFPELKKIDHVMVIDIHFYDGYKQTIGLNTRKCFKFSNTFYHTNFELEKWMDKYIPPARIPW
jgi:hypothetical protein